MYISTAEEFLKNSHLFSLGTLPTECPHPQTLHLSDWSKHDLSKAIDAVKQIDLNLFDVLKDKKHQILEMSQSVQKTLAKGGRVFLYGCGATGRLSLTLETLWRELNPASEQVVALMTGGDVALVHSIEGFEDFTSYGAEQLEELNFNSKDMLIAITEGGETPTVIGAAIKSAEVSNEPTYYLYCNPTEQLTRLVERSKNIIEHNKVKSIELFSGPMVLAGSTRMQASTILQLAAGLALFETENSFDQTLNNFKNKFEAYDFDALTNFVKKEVELYEQGFGILYNVKDYIVTVFTDIAERSPTFSLPSFKSSLEKYKDQPNSLCHVQVSAADNSEEAWEQMLKRAPRPILWTERDARLNQEYLYGFDFSHQAADHRKSWGIKDKEFKIERNGTHLCWKLEDQELKFDMSGLTLLCEHTLLKVLLNTHSTLIMGRMDRYKNNLMTWVKPSNGKLIDRATRYIQYLLKADGVTKSYEQIVHKIFEVKDELQPNQAIVLEVYDRLK